MADVRPFRALRYASDLDLAGAICPPFDIISPEQQSVLHDRSPYNAVHIELADDAGGLRYQRAAETMAQWRDVGTLRRDDAPGFYVYDQQFERHRRMYTRRTIFARVRLEPWEKGAVLPHEQTFGAPKEDRLKLLRATKTNTSPVFLIYRDRERLIEALLKEAGSAPSDAGFEDDDGQHHALRAVDDPAMAAELSRAFTSETLYVADGHHRYETALGYRDECKASAMNWNSEEPENFAMVALASANDPGLVVLPIHRVTAVGAPFGEARSRMEALFKMEPLSSTEALTGTLATHGGGAFGLIAPDGAYLLTTANQPVIDSLLPQERSAAWRQLDYAVANYAILRQCLGLDETQMSDYDTLWFTEEAEEAARDVRAGRARYAVLMNPVPVGRVLDIADSGERMPQKSTFFYPKLPTGLVFNPLED